MTMAKAKWTAIVLTCQHQERSVVYQQELVSRQKKGLIDKDVILLALEDPVANSPVGSGGATLNALLVVTEHISAKKGLTVINPDVLRDANILIMHMGREFPFDMSGRAFVTMPYKYKSESQADTLICNIDLILDLLTNKLAAKAPKGVWICSTDMFLNIPGELEEFDFKDADVCVMSVPVSVQYARFHGVFKLGKDNFVQEIIFRGTQEAIQTCALEDGSVPVMPGVAWVTSKLAAKLLSLHAVSPLDACTYIGLDSGAQPLELSLFFDIFLPMCPEVAREDFVSGNRAGPYGKPCLTGTDSVSTMTSARAVLWKELNSFKIKCRLMKQGIYSYMDGGGTTHHHHLFYGIIQDFSEENFVKERFRHTHIKQPHLVGPNAVVINSVVEEGVKIGEGTVVSNCHLPAKMKIGKNCIVTGITPADAMNSSQVSMKDGMVMHSLPIRIPSLRESNLRLFIILGIHDFISVTREIKPEITFCNMPLAEFLRTTGISDSDLWDTSTPKEERGLLNARLYPLTHCREDIGVREMQWLQGLVDGDPSIIARWRSSWRLTLMEALGFLDLGVEMKWRRDLFYQICQQTMWDTLTSQTHRGLNSIYVSACIDGYLQDMLTTLDKIAYSLAEAKEKCVDIKETETSMFKLSMASQSSGKAARTLASIADVLGCMAGDQAGLRSGPAANKQWKAAYTMLEEGNLAEGVQALAEARGKWLDRPDLLVRAARHYEGAAGILIRQAVMTARQFITTSKCEMPPMGKWVVAKCPARIDIAGCWSDTPPITYEHGGAVHITALQVDGMKPIGAKIKRIPEPVIMLQLGDIEKESTKLVLKNLSDFHDFCQPHAPGALLKAAFLCAEAIEYPSEVSLHDQLMTKYQGGFQLQTWSRLPHGSGLGTSSILAGAVMAVIWKAAGRTVDVPSINHAVLHLEQMLTTGGGWQDQVGGLCGGMKVGYSEAKLPLQIKVSHLDLSPDIIKKFNERLVLVYTGTTRLAKNLLQNVVRNWYARNPEIVATQDELVEIAWKSHAAMKEGNIEEVAAIMNRYWELKKIMAPGSEPVEVTIMMAALKPISLGMSLSGAGGGGFMYVLTKEPNMADKVKEILSQSPGVEGATVHKGEVDMDGLAIEVEE